jgi:hypothetical protein
VPPPLFRQQLGQRGDQCPVGPGSAGLFDLAAQDRDLMTQEQDFLRSWRHRYG